MLRELSICDDRITSKVWHRRYQNQRLTFRLINTAAYGTKRHSKTCKSQSTFRIAISYKFVSGTDLSHLQNTCIISSVVQIFGHHIAPTWLRVRCSLCPDSCSLKLCDVLASAPSPPAPPLLLLLLLSVALLGDTTGSRQSLLKLPTHSGLPEGAQPITNVAPTQ